MFVPADHQIAFDPRQPFSRADARAAGLTPEKLLSKRFHKIFWDSYVSSDVRITPLLRAKAVLRLVPSGSYISHHTAAELWGASAPPDGATHVTLRLPIDGRFARESARTIANLRRRPRFARACRSQLLSRPFWTLPQSASDLST
jgi:hypothetical protein